MSFVIRTIAEMSSFRFILRALGGGGGKLWNCFRAGCAAVLYAIHCCVTYYCLLLLNDDKCIKNKVLCLQLIVYYSVYQKLVAACYSRC